MTLIAVISILGSIIGLQAFLLLKARKAPKRLDIQASDLLHELTVPGGAVLKVEVIDRDNFLLRLPRG